MHSVRNGGAKLIIINSVPLRLREQASQFIHIRPGSEDALVLALADMANDPVAERKMGIDAGELEAARKTISAPKQDHRGNCQIKESDDRLMHSSVRERRKDDSRAYQEKCNFVQSGHIF